MNDTTRLSMVSLGPGDPGLLTLSAARALLDARAILVPTKSDSGDLKGSRSYQTLERFSDFSRAFLSRPFRLSGEGAPAIIPVHTPMRYRKADWERHLDLILAALEEHGTVASVTMGDAGVYSTVYYILDLMKEQFPELHESASVIPGITSFSQASSLAKTPLCVGKSILEVRLFDGESPPKTTVYMRPRHNMRFDGISAAGDLQTFQHLNFEDQKIYAGPPRSADNYMTLTIDFCHRDPVE